jgi:uncharacterized protein (DUF58 family)
VAQTVWQGVHGRRRAGSGESFWQFRRYEQGDPVERIDWRQSARTDKIFIREREWEAAQSAYLWADASGSMHYASDGAVPSKGERARLLMLALASLMLRGGEKVVWLDEDRAISVHGKVGVERIAAELHDGQSLSAPPDVKIARHAHMVLCSDFLMPPEELRKKMHQYAALHLRGILLHVMDPAEEDFAFDGRLEMEDGEGAAPMLLPNAGALRDAYKAKMDEHKERLLHYAESAGWYYVRHVTRETPHAALLRVYQCLAADNG